MAENLCDFVCVCVDSTTIKIMTRSITPKVSLGWAKISYNDKKKNTFS